MATARKPAQPATEPATEPVTVPVIAPDEAWDAVLKAKEDDALARETVLEKQSIVLQEDFDRRLADLVKAHDAEVAALKDQKARQTSIRLSCQAARASLNEAAGTNVVPIKPKADEAPIPEFLRRQPAEAAPAA